MVSSGLPPTIGAKGGRTVAVIGCGHVGLVTAACFAGLGHRVIGVDLQEELLERLRATRPPFYEPGLPELIHDGIAGRRLSFTTSYEEALAEAEFVFLTVNTPATVTGAADLRYIRDAVSRIAQAVGKGRPLIVNKSTSPIGTGETIETILRRALPGDGKAPRIAANPEFLREGSAVQDFLHPERIVIGAMTRGDAEELASLFQPITAPLIITDLRTAEMIKYVSNSFLATKLSFINEIARLCERLDIDVGRVVEGVALDSRIGGSFFSAGIGYGGSCLPKDVAALCHTGETVGVPMRILSSVQEVNANQRKHAVNCIRRAVGSLEGAVVAVWGVTFKGGSEDLRDSPAIDVINLLRNEGARVHAYDPALSGDGALPLADRLCADALEAARDAGAVAILTDWPEFTTVDLRRVAAVMSGRVLFDGRNLLRPTEVEAAGLVYYGVGRPPQGAVGDAEPSPEATVPRPRLQDARAVAAP